MALKSNINSFWQALIIALIIFWTGILIGIFFEDSRVAEVTEFYQNSETSIADFELSSTLVFEANSDCKRLEEESIIFAERIYQEAMKLEEYDNANKITDRVAYLHKKYDLLRTSLWLKIVKNKKQCNSSMNTIVYLYDYKTTDINQVSTQKTMANYLNELQKKSDKITILIPIAVDTGILSIEILKESYGSTKTPSIIINEQHLIEDLQSLGKIESLLNSAKSSNPEGTIYLSS
jgi:hypothetical protein